MIRKTLVENEVHTTIRRLGSEILKNEVSSYGPRRISPLSFPSQSVLFSQRGPKTVIMMNLAKSRR